ncbi:DUF4365 domain-containing protein [Kitasatospora atroaurantiaca]
MGSAGATEVKAKFERLGQGPIEVPQEHDLGLDLLVQARDERGFDAGLLFGVQVKSGSASGSSDYFRSPCKNPDGVVEGWWHRERESKHFDAWIRHGLAVILVLHDLDTSTSYWAQVTPEDVRSTGKGFKICVPASQVIDEEHLPALLEVAASKRAPASWEGSAWLRSGAAVSPGDRLRHALLVPRLVAPHRNVGFAHAIGPEEALALLAQVRIADLDHFASRHSSVPSLEEAGRSGSWQWQLVAAYGAVLLDGDTTAVTGLISSAPGPAERTAATVVAACALLEDEKYAQALQLLTAEIDRDEAEPADFAWLLVQRARVRTELADDHGAGEDAALARITVLLAPKDPTTSAVAAAAAESIFRAAPWDEGELEAFITASDTAASWWRTQNLASAYEQAMDRTFDHWAQTGSIGLGQGNPVYNELEAARWTANLSAHVGAWRACTSLLARQILLDAEQDQDGQGDEESGNALGLLRISGDVSALTKAVQQLRRLGPVAPVVRTVRSVVAQSWSVRAFRAHLELWEHAGDLLEAPAADAAAAHCTALFNGGVQIPPSVSANTDVAHHALLALGGVLEAATTTVHEQVRDLLVARAPWARPALAQPVVQLIFRLADDVFHAPSARDEWRKAALRHTGELNGICVAMLGRIAHTDSEARTALIEQIKAGDFAALAAVGEVTTLGADVGQHAISRLTQEIRALLTGLDQGQWRMRTIDDARALAVLNIAYPQHARWDEIVELVGHPEAPGDYKRGVCLLLSRNTEQIPDQVREDLATALRRAVDSATPPAGPPSGFTEVGGAESWLATALGLLTPEQQAAWRARLLTGNWQQRADAVFLIHLLHRPEDTPLLLALLSDPHHRVRIEAAYEIASRAKQETPDLDARAGLRRAASDTSVVIPQAVAQALADTTILNEDVQDAIATVKNHPSATVRRLACRRTRSSATSP